MPSSSSGSSSGSSSTMRSSRSPVPRPWAAETATGSPRPRRNSSASGHVLDVVDLVGRDEHGQPGAAQEVGDLLVAGAHARAGVDDEHRGLRVGERGLGLFADRAGDRVEVGTSIPPVSTSVKRRPFHSVTISLRSRVTPGRSCTTAVRDPERRLTSEDLPTLG